MPKNRYSKRFTALGIREKAMTVVCLVAALASVLITVGIVVILGTETFRFFQKPEVTLWGFFTGTTWTPTFDNPQFGILPLVNGTLMITVGSALIALPLGLASAIFLSEYAGRKWRQVLKPMLELLAGVPTVVYGFFALFHITPLFRQFFPNVEIYNAASGAVVVGVMILPLVTSLCDDALTAVPKVLREGGVAMGSTSFEVTRKITVPASLSGIAAAFILAFSRAIGETMAVTLAAGQTPKMTLNPAESIETMTAYIVQISKGDTPSGSTAYLTLFAVGAVLFAVTLALNMLARKLVLRYRLVY